MEEEIERLDVGYVQMQVSKRAYHKLLRQGIPLRETPTAALDRILGV